MSRLHVLFAIPVVATLAVAQTPCDSLKLSFPDVSITSITFVPAGPFVAPASAIPTIPAPAASAAPAPAGQGPAAAKGKGKGGAPPAAASVPAYCRVMMVLKPSSDSLIEAAMFLPASNWNGSLQVVGNGGWAGSVSYPAMAAALREGYATAS